MMKQNEKPTKPEQKNIRDILPLTPLQEGILFHYLKDPGSDRYIVQLILDLSGQPDLPTIEQAWNNATLHNETLRTVFRWKKLKTPTQVILKENPIKLRYIDLTDDSTPSRDEIEIIDKDREENFDLQHVPFRVTVIRTASTRFIMLVTSHHILFDGWSQGILLKEFFENYREGVEGKEKNKPKKIKTPFKEFLKYLKNQEDLQKENAGIFWGNTLAGLETKGELPVKKKENREGRHLAYSVTIDKKNIEAFASSQKVTPACILYSIWGILLQRYTNLDDTIFGTTVAGRSAPIPGIQDMVGLFINTIPLRITCEPNETVSQLLSKTQKTLLEREKYDSIPLVNLKRFIEIPGVPGEQQGEIFDTIMAVENYPLAVDDIRGENGLPGIKVNGASMREKTHYDLTVIASMFETGHIDVRFLYNDSVLETAAIERLGRHFVILSQEIVQFPDKSVSKLEMLAEEEKNRLLERFNTPGDSFPPAKTIHTLFERQVEKSPDRTAIVAEKPYTYKELNQMADHLAELLIQKGTGPDNILGIMADRSVEMICGILGTLKAGAGYCPIDPAYPRERIGYILEDSQAKALLTTTNLKETLNDIAFDGETIFLEHENILSNLSHSSKLIKVFGPTFLQKGGNRSPLAYIIYTSGSTGKPKGVMVEHRSLVNIISALQQEYPMGETDTYLLKTSFLFDVSAAELFGWFPGGGRLAILPPHDHKDPAKIIEAINRFQVTHINFVPSMFAAFVDNLLSQKNQNASLSLLQPLKYIFLAGEALLPELVRKFQQLDTGIQIENLYGPTEGTVYSSGYSLSQWNKTGPVPIGKPLPNIHLHILDKLYRLQPAGVPGELFISGTGIARGYLNNPELSAERFVIKTKTLFEKRVLDSQKRLLDNSPGNKNTPIDSFYGVQGRFLQKEPLVLYKTGDLVRWMEDGNLEFLGRIDFQVKVRGFRIELGEIENSILGYRHVRDSVVSVVEQGEGDRSIAAYIVSVDRGAWDEAEMRRYLGAKLPGYMIPAYFVLLDQVPLTASGKVDRKALPQPESTSISRSTLVLPQNEREEKLVQIFSEVTGSASIGIDDNFFHRGGHSLKAIGIITRIHKIFNVEISLSRFFEMPTVRSVAKEIEHLGKPVSAHKPIPKVEEREYYPLSPAQQRFFIIQHLSPQSRAYNMVEVTLVEGLLEQEKLRRTFLKLIERHESFRTSFHIVNGETVQKIHPKDTIEFDTRWYDRTFGSEPVKSMESIIDEMGRPFELSEAPLLRVGVIRKTELRYYLIVGMHHITSDGTSTGILIKDFLAFYKGEDLKPLDIQYRDYVQWRKECQETWERQKLEGIEIGPEFHIEKLNLPTDFVRPAEQNFEGRSSIENLGLKETRELFRLSMDRGVTLYMVLVAVFNVFLSKLSGQSHIAIGSPTAGRTHDDLNGIIGLFINTVVLHNKPAGDKLFSDFLQEVKAHSLSVFEKQDFYYETLLERLGPSLKSGDPGGNPLFDVMFVLQNMEIPGVVIPGLKVKRGVIDVPTAKFDLTVYAEMKGDVLEIKFEYPAQLFKEETIRRYIHYYTKIISEVCNEPGKRILDIDILSSEEKHTILYDFNGVSTPYPWNQTVCKVFEDQVMKKPNSTAVIKVLCHLPFDQVSLTYTELNNKANRLARLLRGKGVQRGKIVGLMLDRSLDMAAAVWAILKAGGTYVPIDPEYPEQRIQSMIINSGASFLLTGSSVKGTRSFDGVGDLEECFLIDRWENQLKKESMENMPPAARPEDLIYIIFTSGSTGKPKGAGVYHRGFMNLMHWFNTDFNIKGNDRNLLVTSLSFDLTQKNLYSPVMTGGTLCIPAFNFFEPMALLREIRENFVTWINCTPSMFYKLVECDLLVKKNNLTSLKHVFLGGEPISLTGIIDWLESDRCRAQVINTYGPSECADISNSFRISAPRRFLTEPIPIGKPVYNVQSYVLDENRQVLPIGVPGELYIGGEGVGIGYINDKELTARKFIMHELEPGKGDELLYRTGDLVKWQTDGNIEFLGRIDHQVKIRGFRIELGEIESILLNHPSVKETVVAARDEGAADKYLCAYIVPSDPAVYVESELRAFLSTSLPYYMVPPYFVRLDKMPLNPNGKVDRKALPPPEIKENENYAPPRDEIDEKLIRIFSEVLGINSCGIDDNFFQLGGHSLKAASLTGKIHQDFSIELRITEIFRNPTVRAIADIIKKMGKGVLAAVEAVEEKEYYPISSAQKRLYLVHQWNRKSTAYNIPFILDMEGNLDTAKFRETFLRLVQRHESFRTCFIQIKGHTVQRVHPHGDVQVEIEYVHTPTDLNAAIKSFIRPFDLSCAPLLRVGLIKQQDNKHIFIADMHHIISDGISTRILVEEFIRIYTGEEKLPPVPVQYKDFTHWQSGSKYKKSLKSQEAFWLNLLTGDPKLPRMDLPVDYPRPVMQNHSGNTLRFSLGHLTSANLKQLAVEEKTTLFMVFLSIFNILLSRVTGQGDILIGSPVMGRPLDELSHTIGMFVNTIVLRSRVKNQTGFKSFLEEVKTLTLEAFENQDYPFEELAEKIQPHRDGGANPVFNVVFAFQDLDIPEFSIPGLTLKPFPYDTGVSKFDLNLTGSSNGEELSFAFEYSTELFKAGTIERFTGYFKDIIDEVIADRNVKLDEIEINFGLSKSKSSLAAEAAGDFGF